MKPLKAVGFVLFCALLKAALTTVEAVANTLGRVRSRPSREP